MDKKQETIEQPVKKTTSKKKTEGVVLMAFGKMGYFYAAYNMALSLKQFNSKIKITLIHDGSFIGHLAHLGFFDKVIKLKHEDLYDNETIMSPAKAKIALYKYLPYDHNLYLDVDGLALRDVQPLIDHCKKLNKPYATEVRGVGGFGDVINYAIWAGQKSIWNFFGLKDEAQYPAIQSSFAYIQKNAKAKKIFDTALKYYKKGFPLKSLTMPWGGTVPDELIFSGTCAKLDYNPTADIYPIFFGWKHTELSYTQIQSKYYVLSLYGNGTGTTLTKRHYIEWYDRLMLGYSRNMGLPYHYKSVYIMKDKHANRR